ncbi:cell wall protein RBR3-like isoform X3 [Zingiber officinale]|uniref:cell wall protein RBR3-like isoform X3 n=1 Tax=Zingiber officinale TaxID=94328 RepID=UPI001C4D1FED|nr:cell wall protein RBR3-like isoform X3 [Zingiber officinale]
MNHGLRAGVMTAPAPERTLTKEADEELALFLEMRKQEKERSNKPPQNASEIDPPLGSKQGIVTLFKITKARMDEFLNSDRGKNDYDWLLTPPGTPIVPSSDTEYRRSPVGSNGTPNARSTMLRSRGHHNIHPQLINAPDPSRDSLLPRPALNSSAMGIRRLSSAGGRNHSGSRPAMPTGRATILAGPITNSRPSTPTSRATIRSKSQAPPPRSSTPVRSSTPTSRPTVLTTASRSSTPSRGNSATIKSRPVKPADIPGFSLDAPPNLRTSLPDRPSSASRGRPGVLSRRSSSVEPGPGARPRRQSCSPSRGRAPNGGTQRVNSVQAPSKLQQSGANVNPIAIGNKMVELTVNMRRLVPLKQHDYRSTNSSLSTRSSLSPGSTGFGRSLSKQSLDMAFRHMQDIGRTIPNNLRPVSASSSTYSVRSGPTRSRTLSVSNSPLATSSTTSSERSVNNNHMAGLDGSEVEEDMISEKGSICSSTLSIAR